MNSCSPSKHSSEQNPSASNFLILPLSSPPCSSTPFLRQPFNLNPNPLLIETSNVIREMQKSICSNVDNFFKMLCNFRSQAGVVDKMMSFSSYIETCCQIPQGKRQNLVRLSESNFAAILPGDSVAGLVVTNGILNFLNIYNTLLIARLVLTWFPSAPPAIVSPLSTLCDPYLNIFRGIIPPLGGTLDLSPILAFLVLNAFTSTASALPAELPSAQVSKDTTVSDHTASQKKWMKRLAGNKPTRSNGEI